MNKISELFKDGVPKRWAEVLKGAGFDCNITRRDLWDLMNPGSQTCSCGVENPWRKTNVARTKTCGNSKCSLAHKAQAANETIKEKYGSRAALGKSTYKKASSTRLDKYGNSIILNDVAKIKRARTNTERYGSLCPATSKKLISKSIDKRNETIASIFENDVLPELQSQLSKRDIEIISAGRSRKETFTYNCTECGTVFSFHLKHLATCPKCFLSAPQRELQNFISNDLKLDLISNDRKLIKPYEIDIVLGNVGIELNGVYWHQDGESMSLVQKSKMASDVGIRLLHIFDFEWNEKQEIVKSIITNSVQKTPNTIWARNTEVRVISSDVARSFFDRTHLAGFARAKTHLGLFYKDTLVSALSIGVPRWSNHDSEIIRFASELNTSVVGAFSKMLKFFIKQNNTKSIISYCDLRIGTGEVYRKNGFTLDGITKPNYLWVKGRTRLPRYKTQKHKLSSFLQNFDPLKSEDFNMRLNGFMKVSDCGNQRWIMIL